MVERNGVFRLFRFSGILGQPREVQPKFRNEIPENVFSMRYPARNFRNFWSNGKRPSRTVFRGPRQNANNDGKYKAMLHSKTSSKRFIIQLP